MNLTCILIDDEPKALTSLAYELEPFNERIQIVAQFKSAKEAITFLEGQSVDVVFLDVNMPGLDGLRFLESFPQRNFEVVFTTAHSEFAIAAFRKEAIGYLVKPIDSEDLEIVLQRIERKFESNNISGKIEEAIDRIENFGSATKRVKFTLDRKIIFVPPADILYCESDGNYCKVILEEKKKLFLTQKLKQVEEILPPNLFFRVHNSYLVNLSKVKEFHKNDGYIVLENNVKIPVSRQKRNTVLVKL